MEQRNHQEVAANFATDVVDEDHGCHDRRRSDQAQAGTDRECVTVATTSLQVQEIRRVRARRRRFLGPSHPAAVPVEGFEYRERGGAALYISTQCCTATGSTTSTLAGAVYDERHLRTIFADVNVVEHHRPVGIGMEIIRSISEDGGTALTIFARVSRDATIETRACHSRRRSHRRSDHSKAVAVGVDRQNSNKYQRAQLLERLRMLATATQGAKEPLRRSRASASS